MVFRNLAANPNWPIGKASQKTSRQIVSEVIINQIGNGISQTSVGF